MWIFILFFLLPISFSVEDNHQHLNYEQASTVPVDLGSLPPESFALLQFDSRPLKNYWLTSALWNLQYCQKHHHQYLYYKNEGSTCHHGSELLADAWCKVRAMLNANRDYSNVKVFIYLDSDAIIDKEFADLSLNQIISKVQDKLQWNPNEKPIIFNQDGSDFFFFPSILFPSSPDFSIQALLVVYVYNENWL